MTDNQNTLKMIPNGPIRVESGTYQILLSDGTTEIKTAPFSLCRCGQSARKPYCDGAHKTCGFEG